MRESEFAIVVIIVIVMLFMVAIIFVDVTIQQGLIPMATFIAITIVITVFIITFGPSTDCMLVKGTILPYADPQC